MPIEDEITEPMILGVSDNQYMTCRHVKSILYDLGPLMSNLILVSYLEFIIITGWVQVTVSKIRRSDFQ